MGQFGIGQPVRRKEDTRLLTGGGKFTDDLNFEGQLYAAFARSPHANAKILGVDLSQPLSPQTAAEIWRVFVDRTVIVFRGQSLTQEQLVEATTVER